MRSLIPLLVAGLTLAGCGAGGELAQSADEHGRPCQAAELEPGNQGYVGDCAQQRESEAPEGASSGGR